VRLMIYSSPWAGHPAPRTFVPRCRQAWASSLSQSVSTTVHISTLSGSDVPSSLVHSVVSIEVFQHPHSLFASDHTKKGVQPRPSSSWLGVSSFEIVTPPFPTPSLSCSHTSRIHELFLN